MIISEQEKNRIRGLHKNASVIKEQASEGTLKTLLHEWIDWIKSSKGAQEAIALMNGCKGGMAGKQFPPQEIAGFPKWEQLVKLGNALGSVSDDTLADYLCTALKPEYNGDWDIIDPKFPEFKF